MNLHIDCQWGKSVGSSQPDWKSWFKIGDGCIPLLTLKSKEKENEVLSHLTTFSVWLSLTLLLKSNGAFFIKSKTLFQLQASALCSDQFRCWDEWHRYILGLNFIRQRQKHKSVSSHQGNCRHVIFTRSFWAKLQRCHRVLPFYATLRGGQFQSEGTKDIEIVSWNKCFAQ